MRIHRMPGFTASASLFRGNSDYESVRDLNASVNGQSVVPQRWVLNPDSDCGCSGWIGWEGGGMSVTYGRYRRENCRCA